MSAGSRRWRVLAIWLVACGWCLACAPAPEHAQRLIVSGSASGAEAEVLARQIARFQRLHPGVEVVAQPVPESAEERHQLYVQWLNAGVAEPDVLQLDVVWLQEFAAAGWLHPLRRNASDAADFVAAARASTEFRGAPYARPWFVDVGMLYYRKDWFPVAPKRFEELVAAAERAQREQHIPYGFVFSGARYEGLVTVFQEVLGGYGGRILTDDGRVALDSEAAVRALTFLTAAVHEQRITNSAALTFQEEQCRFAFQRGQAAFMRNWPYAAALMESDPNSVVRGKIGIASMPSAVEGAPTASLGGQHLAINGHSREPSLAESFIDYVTAPEQMLERAELAGQLPARRSVYGDPRLAAALPFLPADPLEIVEHARPRPPTPVYSELSGALQVQLHRALTRQSSPRQAVQRAAGDLLTILSRNGLLPGSRAAPPSGRSAGPWLAALSILGALLAWFAYRRARARGTLSRPLAREARLAYALLAPTLAALLLLALLPLGLALRESFHLHDLRRPWLGRPFVGLDNYRAVLGSLRFWASLGRSLGFTVVSVGLEVGLGLLMALWLRRLIRGRAMAQALSLVPWAMPTVVVALAFRFLFDSRVGPLALLASRAQLTGPGTDWFSSEFLAWVPIVVSDVWKTSPFVALLLLAGLASLPGEVYEAASLDGAGALRQLSSITLPLLRPVLVVVVVFRSLDAFRVFDLIYVLTHGGPGIATEPIALRTYDMLLVNLDFGQGATLSVLVFAIALLLSLLLARWVGGRELWSSQ